MKVTQEGRASALLALSASFGCGGDIAGLMTIPTTTSEALVATLPSGPSVGWHEGLQRRITVLALVVATLFAPASMATVVPHVTAAPTIIQITEAQKQALIRSAYAQATLILDDAGIETSGRQRDAMMSALGVALEEVLSRTDLLSSKDSDVAEKVLNDAVKAVGAALTSAGVARVTGLAHAEWALIQGAGTLAEVIAAEGCLAGALAAGVALGLVANGVYTLASGDSMGEDLASVAEHYSQADLDAAVEAARAAAAAREEAKKEADRKAAEEKKQQEEEQQKKEEEEEQTPAEDPPADDEGTPNPEAAGSAGPSLWQASGGTMGAAPSLPSDGASGPVDDESGNALDPITGLPTGLSTTPGGGYTDGREPAGSGRSVSVRADLMAIMLHGNAPLIQFTAFELARLSALGVQP